MLHVLYIYLQNWLIWGVHVETYSSTIEHMIHWFHCNPWIWWKIWQALQILGLQCIIYCRTYIYIYWLVVWNISYFPQWLGWWSNLTNMFQGGWNHQLVYIYNIYIYIDGTYITAFDGNNCRTPLGEVAETSRFPLVPSSPIYWLGLVSLVHLYILPLYWMVKASRFLVNIFLNRSCESQYDRFSRMIFLPLSYHNPVTS